MSSAESSSNEPSPPRATSGPSRGSLILVVVTMGLLVALVWALNPPQPDFTPAPLQPVSPGCPTGPPEFTPTNITDLPDLALNDLPREVKNRVLLRLNMEPCPCGCNLSIAACRVHHPACEACKELANQIIASERGGPGAAPTN